MEQKVEAYRVAIGRLALSVAVLLFLSAVGSVYAADPVALFFTASDKKGVVSGPFGKDDLQVFRTENDKTSSA
jgi:hypothetical protein